MPICPKCSSEISLTGKVCPSCLWTVDAETAVLPSDPQSATPTKLESGAKQHNTPITTTGGSGRFVAGTVLAGRYRVVVLIGKGGMGEVYKAEDLELEQTVALKFLPEELAQNDELLRRFRGEVRNARQVSHANVCRVFDIGETEGLYYLTMEYIDGDDLSMLLKRIGRFPSDRAVEVSRQVCMGLAAIHKAGILHRDLKPANIIIDSKGEARITDFGIAGLEAEVQGIEARVGTPAYMSPEQADGKELTKQSDIYSLGLLLYEIFTGKQAYEGDSVQELRVKHATTTPKDPSDIVAGIDPIVEKVINRCLEKDPDNRPDSALRVAMSLPGGDPLQVALEAGETPTPEMVAAAPKRGALKPKVALALLLILIAGIIGVSVFHQYYKFYNIIPLEKSPEVLAERAKVVARNLGYEDEPADTKYGLYVVDEYLNYAAENDSPKIARERLRSGQPNLLYFLYRQSPVDIIPWRGVRVYGIDPPRTFPGSRSVYLDTQGRLIKFVAVPDRVTPPTPGEKEFEWRKLFDEAGLKLENFHEVDSQWTPEVFVHQRKAWEGTQQDFVDLPIHIEAATVNEKLIFFDIYYPWEKPVSIDQRLRQRERDSGYSEKIRGMVIFLTFILVFIGAALLASHNIKSGRGDIKGAVKLTVFCFLSYFLLNLISADHVWSIGGVWTIFGRIISDSLNYGVLIGLIYVALEPFVRRYFAELLVSWSRLLKGDFRDPMIGRDILIGGVFGVGINALHYLLRLLSAYFSGTEYYVNADHLTLPLSGWPGTVAQLFAAPVIPVLNSLFPLFVLVLSFIVIRNKKISIGIVFIVSLVLSIDIKMGEYWLALVNGLAFASAMVLILVRFGLLTLILAMFFQALSYLFILTFNTSSHLFPGTVIVFVLVFVLSIYGFYTSTAGKSVFERRFLEE